MPRTVRTRQTIRVTLGKFEGLLRFGIVGPIALVLPFDNIVTRHMDRFFRRKNWGAPGASWRYPTTGIPTDIAVRPPRFQEGPGIDLKGERSRSDRDLEVDWLVNLTVVLGGNHCKDSCIESRDDVPGGGTSGVATGGIKRGLDSSGCRRSLRDGMMFTWSSVPLPIR